MLKQRIAGYLNGTIHVPVGQPAAPTVVRRRSHGQRIGRSIPCRMDDLHARPRLGQGGEAVKSWRNLVKGAYLILTGPAFPGCCCSRQNHIDALVFEGFVPARREAVTHQRVNLVQGRELSERHLVEFAVVA